MNREKLWGREAVTVYTEFWLETLPSCFEAPSPLLSWKPTSKRVDLTWFHLSETLPGTLDTWSPWSLQCCHARGGLNGAPGGRGSHAAILENIWRIYDLNSFYVVHVIVCSHKYSGHWLPTCNFHTWTFGSRRCECLPATKLGIFANLT